MDVDLKADIEAVPCLLAPSEQADLIRAFYECYYNTDQDTVTFSSEFFYVVGYITSGLVPVKLRYLTDFYDDVSASSPGYKAAYDAYVQGALEVATFQFEEDGGATHGQEKGTDKSV